ncbi:MAG TPA: zinc ribbon domain-containing protein [Longimicrobium sp.]|nr:zinc ribbon domain-containing protein [Longimicrobium sp.]
MPLITCPDCGREVSDAAPTCPHCGRPFKSAPPAPRKPVAGIVVACVLGVLMLLWAHGKSTSTSPEVVEVREMSNSVYTLGCVLLLIGALMSAAGHRWGNRIVRGTSWMMIVLVSMLTIVIRSTIMDRAAAQGRATTPGFGAAVVLLFVVGLTPWLLYLYLFRKSKYP